MSMNGHVFGGTPGECLLASSRCCSRVCLLGRLRVVLILFVLIMIVLCQFVCSIDINDVHVCVQLFVCLCHGSTRCSRVQVQHDTPDTRVSCQTWLVLVWVGSHVCTGGKMIGWSGGVRCASGGCGSDPAVRLSAKDTCQLVDTWHASHHNTRST